MSATAGPGRPARLLHNGETVRDAAERIGVTDTAIRYRLKTMDAEKALSLPRANYPAPAPRQRAGSFGKGKLSLIEIRVLQMLADGWSPKEMVDANRSKRAIQQMMHRMRIKLGAVTTAQMTALGVKKGLIR